MTLPQYGMVNIHISLGNKEMIYQKNIHDGIVLIYETYLYRRTSDGGWSANITSSCL